MRAELFTAAEPEVWIGKTQRILVRLPPENVRALRALLQFVNEVIEHQDTNLMNPKNLSTVLGPNLLRREQNPTDLMELVHANSVVELLILHRCALLDGLAPKV